MARGRTNTTTTLARLLPLGAVVALMAGRAEAAVPIYYNNLGDFQSDIIFSVTDDYSNPGYVFIQSNAVMSAVIGETDYMSTGFMELNIVSGGTYCAGCNGSFELSFQTTTVGNAEGVSGVGMNIAFQDPGNPYFAFITFADGTTDNIQLPGAGSFWGVAAPERIERIHFGLSMGGVTQGGGFGIDNLIVGDGNLGPCTANTDCVDDQNPCTDGVCDASVCTYVPNTAPCDDGNLCTDDICGGGTCVGMPNTAPCDDGNFCTDDICGGGTCVGQFNANPCDDMEVCTENDVCGLGICQGTLVACSDGNECTIDFCEFGKGCAAINSNAPCDDGNACTARRATSASTPAGPGRPATTAAAAAVRTTRPAVAARATAAPSRPASTTAAATPAWSRPRASAPAARSRAMQAAAAATRPPSSRSSAAAAARRRRRRGGCGG
jgi:hypothetical protein